MGKARSTVASVCLSFLPRVGQILQYLGLHGTALIFPVWRVVENSSLRVIRDDSPGTTAFEAV